jgi:hypothetical protein
MPHLFWIFTLTITALVLAAFWEAWLKRGLHMTLPEKTGPGDPGRPDLGTEAIDMEYVRAALRTNDMASSLPGRYSASGRFHFMPTSPKHIKDDETYASRWFQAYGKNPEKDPSK